MTCHKNLLKKDFQRREENVLGFGCARKSLSFGLFSVHQFGGIQGQHNHCNPIRFPGETKLEHYICFVISFQATLQDKVFFPSFTICSSNQIRCILNLVDNIIYVCICQDNISKSNRYLHKPNTEVIVVEIFLHGKQNYDVKGYAYCKRTCAN